MTVACLSQLAVLFCVVLLCHSSGCPRRILHEACVPTSLWMSVWPRSASLVVQLWQGKAFAVAKGDAAFWHCLCCPQSLVATLSDIVLPSVTHGHSLWHCLFSAYSVVKETKKKIIKNFSVHAVDCILEQSYLSECLLPLLSCWLSVFCRHKSSIHAVHFCCVIVSDAYWSETCTVLILV